MEYRQLGRSGLRVSTITMGTMTLGGRGRSEILVSPKLKGSSTCVSMQVST